MNNKDWEEILKLRRTYTGKSEGIALGNLITEQQTLDRIREIVSQYDGSLASMISKFSKIQQVLYDCKLIELKSYSKE